MVGPGHYRHADVTFSAADRRFHGQLMHVRECIEQATLRTIYGIPYDGEVAVDPGEIARGASQFGPAVYGA